MNILGQWIMELGYDNKELRDNSYYCNEHDLILVSINAIKLPFSFPREINSIKYIEGMEEKRAKVILKEIFEKINVFPIEVYQIDFDGIYSYELHDGYHRYAISRFLRFSHIPIKIVKKSW